VDVKTIPRILNSEVVLLAALSVVAFAVFVFTRNMAAREQRMEARIAAIWYQRGEQLIASGEVEKAIPAFRRAAASRDNQQYLVALANALAAGNHDSEAQQLLLQLREADPENAEINTYLARLAAKRDATEDAIHYYQNALYGRWMGDKVEERRNQLRTELIRFLLLHQQRQLASSELLTLEGGLPNDAASHVEVAKFFQVAGDARRAFKNYSAAAELDPRNVDAVTGAGETSFQLGDYTQAVRYLRAGLELDPGSQSTRQRLDLAEMVLDEDPLAPHLTAEERKSRLLTGFELALQRLENCLSQKADSNANPELQSLKAEAVAMQPKLKGGTRLPDFDTVRSGAAIIFRMEEAASASCGASSVEDEALLLIGRQHKGLQP
jgi:tetratricopeptide (TPR) repeat protein